MTDTPLDHLAAIFEQAEAEGRPAFLPYFPIGYPNYEESIDTIEAMAETGVDGFEIGIPFSDPLADGPTIQAATQASLNAGTTVKSCLKAVEELRVRGVRQPMMMMSYLNPLMAYGLEQFVADAKVAGANGLIVPDMPPEESAELAALCEKADLALVFFLAPTSSDERIQMVAEKAKGFIYVVSLTGVTGERNTLPSDLTAFLQRVREQTHQPLVLGFGISTPEHVQQISGLVDGFIVGSALVRAGEGGKDSVRQLASTLRHAVPQKD